MSSCYPSSGSVKVAGGDVLTLESNYSSKQAHTGVMGLFYILVAVPAAGEKTSLFLGVPDSCKLFIRIYFTIVSFFLIFWYLTWHCCRGSGAPKAFMVFYSSWLYVECHSWNSLLVQKKAARKIPSFGDALKCTAYPIEAEVLLLTTCIPDYAWFNFVQ